MKKSYEFKIKFQFRKLKKYIYIYIKKNPYLHIYKHKNQLGYYKPQISHTIQTKERDYTQSMRELVEKMNQAYTQLLSDIYILSLGAPFYDLITVSLHNPIEEAKWTYIYIYIYIYMDLFINREDELGVGLKKSRVFKMRISNHNYISKTDRKVSRWGHTCTMWDCNNRLVSLNSYYPFFSPFSFLQSPPIPTFIFLINLTLTVLVSKSKDSPFFFCSTFN